jgi:hypothetical protein
MSLTNKLLLAKTGTDLVGGLFGPDAKEVAEAEALAAAKFRGAYYGMEADGTGAGTPAPSRQGVPTTAAPAALPAPQQALQQAPQAPNVSPAQAGPPQAPNVTPNVSPEQQALLDGRAKKEELFPTGAQPMAGQAVGPGQMNATLPIPESLFGISAMPNVRYI